MPRAYCLFLPQALDKLFGNSFLSLSRKRKSEREKA
jgi:hypothetical protein